MTGSEWADGLQFLPDERGTVPMSTGLGITAFGGQGSFFSAVADAMRPIHEDGPSPLAVRERCADELRRGQTAHWRGLLSLALLLDTWQENVGIDVIPVRKAQSAFAEQLLSAAGEELLRLVVLRIGTQRRILGLADAELGVVPAAWMDDLKELMPRRADWYLPETNTFADPLPLLNQRDRATLLRRLPLFGADAAVYAREIQAREDELAQGDERWALRVEAAISLSREKAFQELTWQRETCAVSTNPLLTSLGKTEQNAPVLLGQETLLWRGTPIARTNDRCGWEPLGQDGEEQALEVLETEADLLRRESARYRRDWADRLNRFLPGVQTEELRLQGTGLLSVLRQEEQPAGPLVLTWPWDAESPAIRTVLAEAAGEAYAEAARKPFADVLLLAENGDMGDPLLNALLRVENGRGAFWTAVAPVSGGMAEAVSRSGWPDGMLATDCLRLSVSLPESAAPAAAPVQGTAPEMAPGENTEEETKPEGTISSQAPSAANVGPVEAVLKLYGSRLLELHRTYPVAEQRRLRAAEVPEVAMWPSVPVSAERWHAYYVSVKGGFAVSLLKENGWQRQELSEADGFRVVKTDTFPGYVALSDGDADCGMLIYQAAAFVPEHTGEARAVLDPGSSCLSLVLNGERLSMPSLWHVMLRGGESPLKSEPLPVWPITDLLPAGVRLVPGGGSEPFVDGRLLQAEAADLVDNVVANPVWHTDAEGQRARRLMLREAAILLSLHAVMNGADSISYRLVLPDGMAEAGGQALLADLYQAAESTASDTGLSFTGVCTGLRAGLSVGAYLRNKLRLPGSFAVLSVGGMSSSATLWIRGITHPSA